MIDVYYKSWYCNFFIDYSSKDDGSENVVKLIVGLMNCVMVL